VGAFFGFLFGLWFVVGMVISPYFWAKRTTRADSPRMRRAKAMGLGLTWPAIVFRYCAELYARNQGTTRAPGVSSAPTQRAVLPPPAPSTRVAPPAPSASMSPPVGSGTVLPPPPSSNGPAEAGRSAPVANPYDSNRAG
jgi:hypothetical protein